jgi:hypothetical protein
MLLDEPAERRIRAIWTINELLFICKLRTRAPIHRVQAFKDIAACFGPTLTKEDKWFYLTSRPYPLPSRLTVRHHPPIIRETSNVIKTARGPLASTYAPVRMDRNHGSHFGCFLLLLWALDILPTFGPGDPSPILANVKQVDDFWCLDAALPYSTALLPTFMSRFQRRPVAHGKFFREMMQCIAPVSYDNFMAIVHNGRLKTLLDTDGYSESVYSMSSDLVLHLVRDRLTFLRTTLLADFHEALGLVPHRASRDWDSTSAGLFLQWLAFRPGRPPYVPVLLRRFPGAFSQSSMLKTTLTFLQPIAPASPATRDAATTTTSSTASKKRKESPTKCDMPPPAPKRPKPIDALPKFAGALSLTPPTEVTVQPIIAAAPAAYDSTRLGLPQNSLDPRWLHRRQLFLDDDWERLFG